MGFSLIYDTCIHTHVAVQTALDLAVLCCHSTTRNWSAGHSSDKRASAGILGLYCCPVSNLFYDFVETAQAARPMNANAAIFDMGYVST